MGALADVTLLDFSSMGPGPRATRLLADHGMRVVKVRPPRTGTRMMSAPWFAYSANRGIPQLHVDLKDQAGLGLVRRLIARADVLVESFRPGVAARLGIGHEDVRAVREDIVYCSVSGFGQNGPYRAWPAHDLNWLGLCGYLAAGSSRADGGPALPGATIADTLGGYHTAVAILAAVAERMVTGRGRLLDSAVVDGVLRSMQFVLDGHLAGDEGDDPLSGRYACYDVYRAGDGRWLTVAAIEPGFWAALCEGTGIGDRRDQQHDPDRQDELRAALAAAFLTRRPRRVGPAARAGRLRGARQHPRGGPRRPASEQQAADAHRPGRRPRRTADGPAPGRSRAVRPGLAAGRDDPAGGRGRADAGTWRERRGDLVPPVEGDPHMRLDTAYDADRAGWGKPLTGLRVLAAEHMLSLPYATQMLALLGAEVIKVEPPGGEGARAGRPLVPLPAGGTVGGTFARSNLNKSSLVIDLKNAEGRALFLELARASDVVAENMRPGVMDRLGAGYADVAAVNPRAIYLSVSGFGNLTPSPYRSWPAFAPVAEAMSGIFEIAREGDGPPRPGAAGGLGDLSAALFATIGVLAAVRHREATGLGQHVDVSMLDAMLAINDMAAQLHSLGLPPQVAGGRGTGIMATFRAADGHFLIAVLREHQLARLAEAVGRPEWPEDPRLRDRGRWSERVEDIFRPAIEEWAGGRTRAQVVADLAAAGIPAAPCNTMADLVGDPHVEAHRMLVELPAPGGGTTLMPGNPIKMSRVAEGPLSLFPEPGRDTGPVLASVLGLDSAEVARLRAAGAFGRA